MDATWYFNVKINNFSIKVARPLADVFNSPAKRLISVLENVSSREDEDRKDLHPR